MHKILLIDDFDITISTDRVKYLNCFKQLKTIFSFDKIIISGSVNAAIGDEFYVDCQMCEHDDVSINNLIERSIKKSLENGFPFDAKKLMNTLTPYSGLIAANPEIISGIINRYINQNNVIVAGNIYELLVERYAEIETEECCLHSDDIKMIFEYLAYDSILYSDNGSQKIIFDDMTLKYAIFHVIVDSSDCKNNNTDEELSVIELSKAVTALSKNYLFSDYEKNIQIRYRSINNKKYVFEENDLVAYLIANYIVRTVKSESEFSIGNNGVVDLLVSKIESLGDNGIEFSCEICLRLFEVLSADFRSVFTETTWKTIRRLYEKACELKSDSIIWLIAYILERYKSEIMSKRYILDNIHLINELCSDKNDSYGFYKIFRNRKLPIERLIFCKMAHANIVRRCEEEGSRNISLIHRGVWVDEGIPDIMWCEIPVDCHVELGTSDKDIRFLLRQDWARDYDFRRERPSREIAQDEIRCRYIAKYPVTIRQFVAFLEDEDGYLNPEWWDWNTMSREWFNNHSANKAISFSSLWTGQYHCYTAPVTNVSFFEAAAFCNWLSAKTYQTIRLPSEAEWEYVAKNKGTIFSWGNYFDPKVCDAFESNYYSVIPVGCFERGNTNEPQDMNGNVWEWTTTVFELNDDMSRKSREDTILIDSSCKAINTGNIPDIVVKGGSFFNMGGSLRSSNIGRDKIFESNGRQGFRVVKEDS